jgi:cytochrome P450
MARDIADHIWKEHCGNHALTSEAYFDEQLQAWVFSRYMDVRAAFRASSLLPSGLDSPTEPARQHENNISSLRSETRAALSPAQLSLWSRQLAPVVQTAVNNLAANQPVDLMASYAQPCCLALAAMVTGINPRDAERLRRIAEPLTASAADPFDVSLKPHAKAAAAELRNWFRSGPEPLRDSGFVALAHTLPALLANAWFRLVQHPQQWGILHREPEFMDQAIEELLRCAGLPHILFRKATEDVQVGGVFVRKGERVVLKVMEANHDPTRFHHPDSVDIRRRGTKQLSLGAGPHSCVGAGLIRMAAVAMTRPLVDRFSRATLHAEVEWRGGSGFLLPTFLWVVLNSSKAEAR